MPDILCKTVAVIGAGLSGLQAAHLLAEAGIDHVLIEARNRVGGRILSVGENQAADGPYDLGPSWYWPTIQPPMAALVDELGLSAFQQYAEGDMLFERAAGQVPQRFSGYAQVPAPMRLVGGTGALVRALLPRLQPGTLMLGTRVRALRLASDGIELGLARGGGHTSLCAEHVIVTVPPRLLANAVQFEPPLDPSVARRWRETPTWMAPHAKFVALYDRPFWRHAGLSGDAQSAVGPLAEIHDASTAEGKAALFGFVGVPADRRALAGEAALKRACLDQLVRLFGEEARAARALLLKDWAADPLTATAEDPISAGHPTSHEEPWVSDRWRTRVTLAGSETSPINSGYLAGAVAAANRAVQELLVRLTPAATTTHPTENPECA
ncbi:flavin monoamine oxidase family protein [Sphingomonas sp.]|uniref:flavin monoamine oxidase family protein n=1 Tax=Sphingomonas sp. TaxID=28214 RepID=UPI002FD94010